ncbi:MAG: HNH endonuclease signature motif containing protein [bacterium]
MKKKLRRSNSTTLGDSFNSEIIDKVWKKGKRITNKSTKKYRKDIFGREMKYDEYGNRRNKKGWEIDHSKPVVLGGTDHLNNLQPLNWLSNLEKGDNYLY